MRAVVLALIVFTAAGAHAFSIQLSDNGNPLRWNSATVPLYVDEDATSDITNGSDLTAVRKAITSWNDVACSSLVLNEMGTTSSTATIYTTGYLDGKNIIAWIEDDRWELGAWVLGVTTPVFSQSGIIQEADIAMNGYRSEWTTSNTASDKTDVESVTVHELGHFFGAQHVLGGESFSEPPTMSPSVDPYLRTRSLTNDDKLVACFLYPEDTYTCDADSECPRILGNHPTTGEERYEGRMYCGNDNQCGDVEDEDGSGACACDKTTQCDGDCACDPECGDACACDSTTACDSDCDCDPECDDGCAALPSSRTTSSDWVGLVVGAMFILALSRRRRGT